MVKKIQFGQTLALSVTLVMLGMTFLVWRSEQAEVRQKRTAAFETAASQIASNVQERLSSFELILKGTKGFYEGSDDVTREEFSSFYKSFSLDPSSPGLQSVAIALQVPAQGTAAYLAAQRKTGASRYAIEPTAERDHFTPITLIEPQNEKNATLIGFDVASNPHAWEALKLARDTGQMAISGRLEQGRDAQGEPATVAMFVPIFKKNAQAQTIEGRRGGIAGWVSGAFRVADLMAALQGQIDATVAVEIYQSKTPSEEGLLHNSQHAIKHEESPTSLQTTKTVAVGGKLWTLYLHSQPAFDGRFDSDQPWHIAAAGISLSVLMGWMVLLLSNGRARAMAQAHDMTADLRRAQADLEGMLDALPDVLFELGLDGRYYKYRTSRSHPLAAPSEYFLGKLTSEILPPAANAMCLDALQEAYTTGFSNGRQLEIPSTKGTRWYEISVARKSTSGTEGPRFIMISRNITQRKLAELELQKTHAQLQLLETCVARLNDIILITEAEPFTQPGPKIVYVNDAFVRRTGYTREEVIGQSPRILQGPKTQHDVLDKISAALHKWEPVRAELINYTKSGHEYWLELDIVPVANEKGWYTHWVAVERDITERKLAESQLQLSAQVFNASMDGIIVTDADNRITSVNQAFTTITGYTADEAVGKNPGILRSNQHDADFYKGMWQAIHQAGHWQGEIMNCRKGGETYPEWLSISAVKDTSGRIVQYIGILTDLTDSKAALARIDYLAHYDTLTRLPNRELLQDRAKLALASADRTQSSVALMFMDIDRFQNINDSLGHPVGDQILQTIGARLTAHLHADDTVCRQGGDEFILLLPNTDASGAAHVANRILSAIAAPATLQDNHQLSVTASVGIAIFPDNGKDFERLSQCADAALLQAKQNGRNNFQFFAETMHARAREELLVENQLRKAIAKDELVLHYQPQVEAASGRIVGVEALIRWQHPEWGMVSPARFIPIAERSGQILDIGNWVLHRALEQTVQWQSMGLHVVPVAVNLSGLQFRQASLCDTVAQALQTHGVSPGLLELELTESVAMEDSTFTIDQISRLHDMGITLSIDDFGTGYSSLSYLKRYKIDKLKIDLSFVRELDHSAQDDAIVRTIINLAHGLGFKTIAEGVETAGQLAYLQTHGCDEIQGYFFSRPVTAEAIAALLRGGQPLVGAGNNIQ